MKQKKIIYLLAVMLFCLPKVLLAQHQNQISKMKPGDWFEVLVSDTARKPNSESYRYNIRFLLKKTSPDGKKSYAITFERIRMVFSAANGAPLGYDSYYPPFKQGISHPTLKPSFQANLDPTGRIIEMKPDTEFPRIQLTEIAVRKSFGGSSADFESIHRETATVISELIFKAIANNEKQWHNGRLYKDSGLSFVISSASFPLRPNVIVEGRIENINEVNRSKFKSYVKTEGGYLLMEDGSQIPVSRQKKEEVLAKILS